MLDLLHSTSEKTCRQMPVINLSTDVGVSNGMKGSLRELRRGKRLSLCIWRTARLLSCCCSMDSGSAFLPLVSPYAGLDEVVRSRRPPTTFRLLDGLHRSGAADLVAWGM